MKKEKQEQKKALGVQKLIINSFRGKIKNRISDEEENIE